MSIEAPTAAAVGIATAGIIAALDPAIANIILAVIAGVVVIVPIWLKFKIDAMALKLKEQDVRIQEVIKTSDGMKDALVKATAIASRAEGVMAGVAQAETKAAVVMAATADGKASGVAQEKEAEKNRTTANFPPG